MLARLLPLIPLLQTFVIACAPVDDEDSDDPLDGADEHGFNGFEDPGHYDNDDLVWRKAQLTWFESYPDTNGEGGFLELLEGEQMTEGTCRP